MRKRMTEVGITGRALAHKLRCGETQVSKWVNGVGYAPGPKYRRKIARHLDTMPEDLWPDQEGAA